MSRLDSQGQPLPEIVDFRLTKNKKKAIFFIREGETFYRKHLDLTKEGAGLWAISPAAGVATLRRERRRFRPEQVGTPAFERFVNRTFLVAFVSPEMAEALALAFWGKELDATNWPEPEGVQPAQPEAIANAAD